MTFKTPVLCSHEKYESLLYGSILTYYLCKKDYLKISYIFSYKNINSQNIQI